MVMSYMTQKIFNSVSQFVRRLTDVRFLGQIIFVIITLLVSWNTAKAIQQNYDIQKQVATKQKENEVQKLKNQNLKIKNQYLETDEYLELAARRQLGKAAPGETVVIVPKEVAMRYTVDSSIKSDSQIQQEAEEDKPTYQRNLEAWGRFFFRR